MGSNSGETGGEITKRKKKHRKHTLGKPGDHTVHKHMYGFVEIENPEYYDNHDCFAPPVFLMRKATPEERREMVINYIIRRRGKPIDLEKLAVKLAVSKRTIQSLMRRLKDDQLIEVKPNFDEAGRQIRSSYLYIGPKCETYGSGLTIGMLYDLENRAGFRDWEWDDFSYKNTLRQEYDRLIYAYKKIGDDGLLDQAADIDADCKKLEREIVEEREIQTYTKQIEENEKMLRTLPDTWGVMTPQEKQNVVRSLVAKVELKHGEIKVYLNKTQYEKVVLGVTE